MKVTVTEALRLKNEVATIITALQREACTVQFGKFFDDGKEIISEGQTFTDYLINFSKLLKISEEINDKLAEFNVNSKISSMVRQKTNFEVLIRTYSNAISNLRPSISRRYEVVGSARVEIKTEFIPYLTKKEIKDNIKICKVGIRELQKKIDICNREEIEFSFSYEDIENSGSAEDSED